MVAPQWQDERDLVNRCLAGDRAAQGRLVQRYQEGLQRFVALRLGKRNPDVNDMVQEILVRCLCGPPPRLRHFDSNRGSLQAFLVHCAKAKLRQQERRRHPPRALGLLLGADERVDENETGPASEISLDEVLPLLPAEERRFLDDFLTHRLAEGSRGGLRRRCDRRHLKALLKEFRRIIAE